jgi:hypothetical protein
MPRVCVALAACLCSSVAHAQSWWPFGGPKTYDECLLAEMKGQDKSMQFTADKVCSRRFKKELFVPRSVVKFEWSLDSQFAKITISESGEYQIVSAKVQFAPKCDDVKDNTKWGGLKSAVFVNNIAIVPVNRDDIATDLFGTCIHVEEFRGIYK